MFMSVESHAETHAARRRRPLETAAEADAAAESALDAYGAFSRER